MPVAVILLGCALRLRGYLAGDSLGIDEAALARNVIDRSWIELLRPLDYAQVAPPGFLLLEKSAVSVLGTSELALRLFPLLFGIGSVWLSWEVARRVLPNVPALCAVAFVASHTWLIVFSAQVKQYSAETAAALLIVLLALGAARIGATLRRQIAIGAIGAVTVLFSFTAVFVLAGAALTTAVLALRGGDDSRREGLIVPAFWAAAALGGVLIGRASLTPVDAGYLQWFWQANFVNLPPQELRDLLRIEGRIEELFGSVQRFRTGEIWVALTGLGVWSLIARRRPDLASLLSVPLLLVVAAAALHLYPLNPRLQLFLVPLLLLLAAEGVGFGQRMILSVQSRAAVLPIILAALLTAYSLWEGALVRASYDPATVVQHIATHRRSGDRIYVHYAAGQAFVYYAARNGIEPSEYVIGSCSHGSGRTYLEELDRLRGHDRVWIAMTSFGEEPALFTSYLDAIGRRRETIGDAAAIESEDLRGAFGYLYDLTESPRSASVSPDRFELPDGFREAEPYRWTCHGVFTPLPHH
ncbi:MAG: ArnT family glycosyltransferase [Vicinamibacterales bacterium]